MHGYIWLVEGVSGSPAGRHFELMSEPVCKTPRPEALLCREAGTRLSHCAALTWAKTPGARYRSCDIVGNCRPAMKALRYSRGAC